MAHRTWQIWFVALAFLVKVLVPAGYMLEAPADGPGLPRIVICTGSGAKLVTFDHDGRPVEKDAGKSEWSCPFAVPTVVVLPDLLGLPGAQRFAPDWITPVPTSPPVKTVGHGWRARGPPSGSLA